MKRTFIIASGAYVEPELEAEFGRLPPSFLPLANRRLFVHQHAAIAEQAERILLSLPEGFEPDTADLALLGELGIETVAVPVGLSLGQSIVYVINIAAAALGPLSILHGDTLLKGLDLDATDAVSIQRDPAPGYHWASVRESNGRIELLDEPHETQAGRSVLTGYFCFSDASRFVQAVTKAGGSFLAGIAGYASSNPLAPLISQDWFDFGHANTYHRSRRKITTQRDFNRLVATRRSVSKSGTKPAKIEAEARWFEALPPAMRLFAPAYLGRHGEGAEFSYALEYLLLPTLSDLFVFGRLGRAAWDRIFIACDEFLSLCKSHSTATPVAAVADGLYLGKTQERLEVFAKASGTDLKAPCRLGGTWLPSLEKIAALAASAIRLDDSATTTLVHGDFCFSNVLYDARADIVRVIDPRGLDGAGNFDVHGDIRYDIAKLYHSTIGLYDHIIAGNFRLSRRSAVELTLELPRQPNIVLVGQSFLSHEFAGYSPAKACAPAIAVLLFLSMLPLHSDNPERQTAMLANAMRLFLDFDANHGG